MPAENKGKPGQPKNPSVTAAAKPEEKAAGTPALKTEKASAEQPAAASPPPTVAPSSAAPAAVTADDSGQPAPTETPMAAGEPAADEAGAGADQARPGQSRYLVRIDDASGLAVEILKMDQKTGETRPLTNGDIAASLTTAFAAQQLTIKRMQLQMDAIASGRAEGPVMQQQAMPAGFSADEEDGSDPVARAYYQGALDFLNKVTEAAAEAA